MRLIFVNRFYWPETPATGQLLADLAEALAARGVAVEVIASRPDSRLPAREVRRGVVIHRLRGTRWARRGGVAGKAADFASFLLRAVILTFRLARRNSVVVALTDPPMLGLALAPAARVRRSVLIHWVQDIYPEIAIALSGSRALRVLVPARNAAWRAATMVVTLGRDMAARVRSAGVAADRIEVISNWALEGVAAVPPEAVAARRTEWQLDGCFVLLYSGNLGRVHDLEPVLGLAAELADEPRLRFVFVGDGAQRSQLEAAARTRGLRHVSFRPPQPRTELARTLALADLHLVTLRRDCADLVFPSKLYGAAAAARPIVFLGPEECEVARLVTALGLGLAGSRDNLPALANRIRALVADASTRAQFASRAADFARGHSAAAAADLWLGMLSRVTPAEAPAS